MGKEAVWVHSTLPAKAIFSALALMPNRGLAWPGSLLGLGLLANLAHEFARTFCCELDVHRVRP